MNEISMTALSASIFEAMLLEFGQKLSDLLWHYPLSITLILFLSTFIPTTSKRRDGGPEGTGVPCRFYEKAFQD